MQWPVKKKDPSAPNITRWVEKFAFHRRANFKGVKNDTY